MKYHVCVDARLYFSSGIGTFLRWGVKGLIGRCELTFLCKKSDCEALQSISKRLEVMDSPIYSLKEQTEYLKKIPKCDLFWAPHFNIPLLPIKAKKRLTTVCDVYHLAHFKSLTLSQKSYAKVMYNSAFLMSDMLMTISEFSKQEILRHATIKPKKLEIVHPGLDLGISTPSIRKQSILLCVGNLKPHKNLVRLVEAFGKLKPPYPLYIVGAAHDLITPDSEVFRQVEKDPFLQKNVIFTGYIPEKQLKNLYSKAILFIFPSLYEGFGYPPLEAMAYGCPVVASRAGSIPEVCKDAVEYVDPYSVDSIMEGMKRVLEDQKRREELIEKGKQLASEKSKQENRIMELIDACCSSA